jgi:hypothetical protein
MDNPKISEASWDYVVLGVDVPREEGEDIRRLRIVDEVTADLAEAGFVVQRVRPNEPWELLVGLPYVPRKRPEDVAAFELLDALEFVLQAAAAGVIGNRIDAAVLALSNALRGRVGASTVPALDRDKALGQARMAVIASWPKDTNPMLPETLAVVWEQRRDDGSWEFALRYSKQIAPFKSELQPWLFTARVLPREGEHCVVSLVRREPVH